MGQISEELSLKLGVDQSQVAPELNSFDAKVQTTFGKFTKYLHHSSEGARAFRHALTALNEVVPGLGTILHVGLNPIIGALVLAGIGVEKLREHLKEVAEQEKKSAEAVVSAYEKIAEARVRAAGSGETVGSEYQKDTATSGTIKDLSAKYEAAVLERQKYQNAGTSFMTGSNSQNEKQFIGGLEWYRQKENSAKALLDDAYSRKANVEAKKRESEIASNMADKAVKEEEEIKKAEDERFNATKKHAEEQRKMWAEEFAASEKLRRVQEDEARREADISARIAYSRRNYREQKFASVQPTLQELAQHGGWNPAGNTARWIEGQHEMARQAIFNNNPNLAHQIENNPMLYRMQTLLEKHSLIKPDLRREKFEDHMTEMAERALGKNGGIVVATGD
jgi:hypothetical protein